MSAELGSAIQPQPTIRHVSAPHHRHWIFQEPLAVHFYRYPMLWMLLAMLLGGSWREDVSPRWWWGLVAALPGLLLAGAISHRWGYRLLAGGLVLTAVAAFAAAHGSLFQPRSADSLSTFAQRQAEPIAVRAVVDSVAVWKPNLHHRANDASSQPWQTQWDIDCEAVRDGERWTAIEAHTTLTVDGRIDDLLPGDVIEVFGSFHAIVPPTNPGAFDFAEHARNDSHFLSISAQGRDQLTLLGHRSAHFLLRLRGKAVRAVDGYLHRWIPWNQAPLAAALIFGQRSQVDWEGRQELMATGTLHLLAISGLHVGILAAVVVLVCALLDTRNLTQFLAVAGVCGLYAALAGGQPPVLRALVLISLFALARVWGRRTRLANLLSVAAIILLLMQAANATNVGVHLSFLAVGSIGVFAAAQRPGAQRRTALQTVVEESYSGWRRYGLLCMRSAMAAVRLSFWVWLMTCPLVWTSFHVVAPVAIPLNVLVAPPLTVSLLGGLIVGCFGWLPPLAWAAGTISGAGLALISWMISLGHALPLGHFWLPAPPLSWVVSFYGLTLVWLVLFGQRRRGTLAALLSLWIVLGIGWFSAGPRGYATPPDSARQFAVPGDGSGELRCTFLDVGHGTSVVIEFPSREVWLYDAGRLGAVQSSHQGIATALWSLPTARIDNLIISHADADHYNATRGLLERFNVGSVTSTARFWRSTSRDVLHVHAAIDERGVRRAEWSADSSGNRGSVQWHVLHPADSLASESDNASSLCVMLEYAGKRILLPGDLEGTGLLDLVELPERPCHALMAPHHGSLTHDPSELLAWCRPEVIVISGNHRAIRPRVLEQYRQPGATLGVTFRDGAIQLRVTADGDMSSWHWRRDRWVTLE